MRPIDADALKPINIVERKRVFKNGRLRMETVYAEVYRKEDVDNATTIEAAPVVHGKWILKDEKGNGVCSNCNRQDKIDSLATHCRYCGARMDGKAV